MHTRTTNMLCCHAIDRDRQHWLELHRCVLARGQRRQLWSKLSGRSRCLLDLASIEADCEVRSRCDGGLCTVPIDQIRGSEGRVRDFDRDFNPLQFYTRERWLGIAAARQRGRDLPPVALTQVGDLYFVRDGHHRISVARALGQKAIEAKVVVWQVDGPLPWEKPAQASSRGPRRRPIGLEGAFKRLQREGDRLQARARLGLRHLLSAPGLALRTPLAPRPGADGL